MPKITFANDVTMDAKSIDMGTLYYDGAERQTLTVRMARTDENALSGIDAVLDVPAYTEKLWVREDTQSESEAAVYDYHVAKVSLAVEREQLPGGQLGEYEIVFRLARLTQFEIILYGMGTPVPVMHGYTKEVKNDAV